MNDLLIPCLRCGGNCSPQSIEELLDNSWRVTYQCENGQCGCVFHGRLKFEGPAPVLRRSEPDDSLERAAAEMAKKGKKDLS